MPTGLPLSLLLCEHFGYFSDYRSLGKISWLGVLRSQGQEEEGEKGGGGGGPHPQLEWMLLISWQATTKKGPHIKITAFSAAHPLDFPGGAWEQAGCDIVSQTSCFC